MPESQFVSAAKLKPFIAYCAVAFVVIVVLGTVVPPGGLRRGLVVGWLVFFPVGAWMVFKRG